MRKIPDYRYLPHPNHLNKIETRVRCKGGLVRYFSLPYLKFITLYGSCHIDVPASWINIYLDYLQVFLPQMEAEGWKRETLVVDSSYGMAVMESEQT
jgi:hypothetical protein